MENIKIMLDSIKIPDSGLSLKKYGLFYWGKGANGDIVYGIESKNTNLSSLTQSTKYLKIYLNTIFDVTYESSTNKKNLSLIVLKKDGMDFLDIFIRLTATIDNVLSDQELLNYFLNLKNLFSNDSKKSIKELQGLYGELYSMVYFKDVYNLNLAQYYQSEDKRKFDFSVTATKKIEIKTTTLPARIHHFKLEQLNVLRYDILVVSIMFQKDDCGLSLFELIQRVKDLFSNNLKLMIHIENMIKNIDYEVLESIKYNKIYIDNNIKFFDANRIPRIQEKTVDGVFNVEFDSDLSSSQPFDGTSLVEWLERKED